MLRNNGPLTCKSEIHIVFACFINFAPGRNDELFDMYFLRFLGYYQPQLGKPALWELDSDQHYDLGKRVTDLIDDNFRYIFMQYEFNRHSAESISCVA